MVKVNKEYVIYDTVSMIGSVGGTLGKKYSYLFTFEIFFFTLGMCIGFSFANVTTCLINLLQRIVNSNRPK